MAHSVIQGIELAGFLVKNKLGKVWFFEETFLLADTSIKVVLRMVFLTLSNTDMQFMKKELEWRSYTTAEVLPTTKKVKLIDKREFATIALNENIETFMIYVATLLSGPAIQVHFFCQTQVCLLLVDKSIIKVPSKYLDYADIFLFDLMIELPENMDMNEYNIELIDGK